MKLSDRGYVMVNGQIRPYRQRAGAVLNDPEVRKAYLRRLSAARAEGGPRSSSAALRS